MLFPSFSSDISATVGLSLQPVFCECLLTKSPGGFVFLWMTPIEIKKVNESDTCRETTPLCHILSISKCQILQNVEHLENQLVI